MTGDDDRLLTQVHGEEAELQFQRFDNADAWELGCWLVATGLEREQPIAISINFGRQRVFHAALPGSSADNDAWIDRKFRSVEHFGTASLAVGASFRSRGRDFATESGLDPRKYSCFGGAFALRVNGRLIGVVGVSGMSELEDHALVVEALRSAPLVDLDGARRPT
jgi:uncharacterized protein (UPF0303 family)